MTTAINRTINSDGHEQITYTATGFGAKKTLKVTSLGRGEIAVVINREIDASSETIIIDRAALAVLIDIGPEILDTPIAEGSSTPRRTAMIRPKAERDQIAKQVRADRAAGLDIRTLVEKHGYSPHTISIMLRETDR